MGYIKSVYGSPRAALSAWQSRSPHWYMHGGTIAPGETGVVGEAGPELVTAGKGGAVVTPGGTPYEQGR